MSIGDYFTFNGGSFTVSLHTADPGTTGANEVHGGGYARQPAEFSAGVVGSVVTIGPSGG